MGLEHVGHWIGSWNSRGSKLKRTCCSKNTPIIPKHAQKLCSGQAGGGSSLSRQILWLGFPSRVLPVKWPTESFKRETWGGLDRIFKWLQTGVTARVDRVPIWLWKQGLGNQTTARVAGVRRQITAWVEKQISFNQSPEKTEVRTAKLVNLSPPDCYDRAETIWKAEETCCESSLRVCLMSSQESTFACGEQSREKVKHISSNTATRTSSWTQWHQKANICGNNGKEQG